MVPSPDVISLHPLSLLGISDYYTRFNSRVKKNDTELLIGGLLGKHNSVLYSFEILIDGNGIVQEFLDRKLRQFKIIYPNTAFMGFYQISPDLQIDKLTINLISSLPYNLQDFIYLVISPTKLHKLPLKLFSLSNLNKQLVYEIESAPSEKASLNSIRESQLKPDTKKPSEIFTSKNQSLKQSLINLSGKITKIVEFLQKDDDFEGKDELLLEIDKFVFELEYNKANESFQKDLNHQRLELLMTATSNLMILLKHE